MNIKYGRISLIGKYYYVALGALLLFLTFALPRPAAAVCDVSRSLPFCREGCTAGATCFRFAEEFGTCVALPPGTADEELAPGVIMRAGDLICNSETAAARDLICAATAGNPPTCDSCALGAVCYLEGREIGYCSEASSGDGRVCSAMTDEVAARTFGVDENETATIERTLITPQLAINIPTVNLTKVRVNEEATGDKDDDGTPITVRHIDIPWIADYISGAYRYAVFFGSLLAVMLIMFGGLRWLSSGGNASVIGRAKAQISGAVVGLILLLGGYLILNLINPELTALRSIDIVTATRQLYEGAAPDLDPNDGGPNWSANASTEPSGGGGASGGAVSSHDIDTTVSSEDCQRVAQLVRDHEIVVGPPDDRAGLIAGGVITRTGCKWCYTDRPIAPNATASVNRGGTTRTERSACYGEGMEIAINPKICTLLLRIYEATEAGEITGDWGVNCIICGHSRCSKRTEDVEVCTRCIDSARPNEVAWGQSNHWRGNGIDLWMNESLQQWIFNNLQGLGLVQLYGSYGWASYPAMFCPHRYTRAGEYNGNPNHKDVSDGGTGRSGSTHCAYCCNNGRCPATVTAQTMCGHLNHIHVGFGQ
ncbi:MAG: hypothetical protein V1738_00785 [Patescibacteria group bacterium]